VDPNDNFSLVTGSRFGRQCYCKVYDSCSKCPSLLVTWLKTFTPLVNCIVNDSLVYAIPNVQQMLPEFVNGKLNLSTNFIKSDEKLKRYRRHKSKNKLNQK